MVEDVRLLVVGFYAVRAGLLDEATWRRGGEEFHGGLALWRRERTRYVSRLRYKFR